MELMDFTYLTATKLPFKGDQHKLPADVRAKQQSDELCRRVLSGRQVQLAVAECVGKGWGVIAAQEIQQGEYLGEYTGELISSREMRRRYRDVYDSEAKNYVLSLREHVAQWRLSDLDFEVVRTNVDASFSGNLTRFFNHSCSPTLEVAARCANCDAALFCDRECQVKAWPGHKAECTVISTFKGLHKNTSSDSKLAELLETLSLSTTPKQAVEPKTAGVASSIGMTGSELPGWFFTVDFAAAPKEQQKALYQAALELYGLLKDEECW
ncbi:hypothetical protein BBO99_00002727 [Phytophthora kernoviae]|uniref:MYND-type domain-containing protein n=2 Tax=Phytophthora kernoviae TaxID=325452 RepID=A0A3R7JZ05_9STRA|nr:hypothetical protein G195_004183 [Phytophthora kernoviae 00238/432]KAG2526588.1 hypothetical protein JM16_003696 [Phytophthora kernoviae]KAG2528205.1 hypothetical protein JM18_003271 [Phytophthora kernoviae]RLN37164.1 hypothetical protein BBI17_004231 [Phytophthora kernoviae]RLN82676.1 hypothetical protein BBO99_00002727 [Phytophthora kernoviae]